MSYYQPHYGGNLNPGYDPPPIPGQPNVGAYQPPYPSPPYHPPQGPPQSFYPPPSDQTSYHPPPPTGPRPGYPAPPVPYSQQIPPPPIASTYPGGPQASHVPALWYLGTEVPNIFISADHIVPGYNPAGDAEKIRNATKGFGTNDDALITTLAPLSAMKMQAVSNRFVAAYGLQLVEVLDKETTFNFKYVNLPSFISNDVNQNYRYLESHSWCLRALVMGPLRWDVWLLREAMQGIGTKEKILTEILLARPMSEIRLLMDAYQYYTRRNLIQDVQNDLSMKTQRSQFSRNVQSIQTVLTFNSVFLMALSSDRSPDTAPVDYAHVARDVDALYNAGEKRFGTDEVNIL
ncbi:hypothetical protein C0992_011483 [Termitomyces sp. T32_za158]|nr:hypothetical protein C0992_011483 [Termitomyces sp. T32_za158]